MKKLLVASSIILLALASAHATVYKTLVLNDGFKLTGCVMEEVPGKSVTIRVDTIAGRIDKSFIEAEERGYNEQGVSLTTIKLNAKGKKALNGSNGKPVDNNYAYNSLQGSIVVKNDREGVYEYVCAPKGGCGTYTIVDNTIRIMERTPRPKDAARGLVDVITTKDGEQYEGQIVRNILGKTITIRHDDGRNIDIVSNDIISMEVRGLDDEEDILKQTEFLDVIYAGGYETPLRGVLVAKIYDENPANDKITIHTESGLDVDVPYDLVSKFSYEKNKSYKPGKKYTVGINEVWVNGHKAKRYEGEYRRTNSNHRISMKAYQQAIKIDYADLEDGVMVLECKTKPGFKNPLLLKMDENKTHNGAQTEHYIFKDSELMNDGISHDSKNVSSNGIVKLTYPIDKPERGTDYYILYFGEESGPSIYIVGVKR